MFRIPQFIAILTACVRFTRVAEGSPVDDQNLKETDAKKQKSADD
jgi:hypothetical protein